MFSCQTPHRPLAHSLRSAAREEARILVKSANFYMFAFTSYQRMGFFCCLTINMEQKTGTVILLLLITKHTSMAWPDC